MNINADMAWDLTALGENNSMKQFDCENAFERLVNHVMWRIITAACAGKTEIIVHWTPFDRCNADKVIAFLQDAGYQIQNQKCSICEETEDTIISWRQ